MLPRVRNQRSKDDVPHMFRAVPWMMRVAEEAPDEDVREAAATCLEYMRGFAKDIVDQGYLIRTRNAEGEVVVPKNEEGAIKDLASFVSWEDFIPNGECTAKLVTALVAYGEPLDNDCGKGFGGEFETIATQGNYYNYAIIRYFHVAAMYMALVEGHPEVARELMVGLAERMDGMLHDEELPHYGVDEWWPDAASILLASAAAGLPLTHEEARLIQEQYTLSAEHYRDFPNWDPWADSVPDGEFDYLPKRGVDRSKPRFGRFVRATTLGYLIEYCASPYRSPDGARVVDCDRILDPATW